MFSRRQFTGLSAAPIMAACSRLRESRDPRISPHLALQTKSAQDPQRPRYHLVAPAGKMGDPNGPIFWNGNYHMFYIHDPAFAGTQSWGHAVSNDLVHWKHLPIALAPTPGGPDKGGCWSGCTIINNGIPTIFYTGVAPEVQCLATSDDQMIIWKKHPGNPVIGSRPSGLELTGFRDPYVWREGKTWYMLIGSGFEGVGGAALLYTSLDLLHWKYVHPLLVGEKDAFAKASPGSLCPPCETGEVWEVPDLFPLADKHVLTFLAQGKGRYLVGTYADQEFRPEAPQGVLDFGSFYAPRTMLDSGGRRVLWGWLLEQRDEKAQRAAGWSGAMSLPRVLTLSTDGMLHCHPAHQLEMLRGKLHRFRDIHVTSTSSLLEGVAGDCLEIAAEFEPGDAEEFGLQVRCAPGGREQTLIGYSRADKSLKVDKERSSLSSGARRDVRKGALHLASGETLKLRVFLDCSVIEVFANGRTCLTDRIYPSRANSLGIGLFALGGTAKLPSLDIWEMKPISPDRLIT